MKKSSVTKYAPVFSSGKFQRLKCCGFARITKEAFIDYSLSGFVQLSKLRKELVVNPQIDLLTVFMPYRRIMKYGTMIDKGSSDEFVKIYEVGNVDLFLDTMYDLTGQSTYVESYGYSNNPKSDTVQQYACNELMIAMYYAVEKHFVTNKRRVNTSIPADIGYTLHSLKSDDVAKYGVLTAPLPSLISMAPISDVTTKHLFYDFDNPALHALDVLDQRSGFANLELDRKYNTSWYRDIVSKDGGSVSADVDDRPSVILHETFNIDGRDVFGTTENTLGTKSGINAVDFNHRVKFKTSEDGVVATYYTVRFPTVMETQKDFIQNRNFNYLEFSGDPTLRGNIPQEDRYVSTHTIVNARDTPDLTAISSVPIQAIWDMQAPLINSDFFDKGYPLVTGNHSNLSGGWSGGVKLDFDDRVVESTLGLASLQLFADLVITASTFDFDDKLNVKVGSGD